MRIGTILCAPCVDSNQNAAYPVRIGGPITPRGHELEDTILELFGGKTIPCAYGTEIPPGGNWLALIAEKIGRHRFITENNGRPMEMFAVTWHAGTPVCSYHLYISIRNPGSRVR